MDLDVDEARSSGKAFIGVGEALAGLVGKASFSGPVAQGLPGSATIDAARNMEQALQVALRAQADWPPRVSKEVLEAVGTITGIDEVNAAGLKLDTSGDPPSPGGKTGADDQPPPAGQKPPADQPHDPAPPNPDPSHNPDHPDSAVDPRGQIPYNEVQFAGSGQWPKGREACINYINKALDARGITDPQARANWMQGMLTIAEKESQFNSPDYQVNTYDSNAKLSTYTEVDGYGDMCSRGPWQCIRTTFAENHQAGTSTNIYDPVASCAADMNHIIAAWGVSPDGHDLLQKCPAARPETGQVGQ